MFFNGWIMVHGLPDISQGWSFANEMSGRPPRKQKSLNQNSRKKRIRYIPNCRASMAAWGFVEHPRHGSSCPHVAPKDWSPNDESWNAPVQRLQLQDAARTSHHKPLNSLIRPASPNALQLKRLKSHWRPSNRPLPVSMLWNHWSNAASCHTAKPKEPSNWQLRRRGLPTKRGGFRSPFLSLSQIYHGRQH